MPSYTKSHVQFELNGEHVTVEEPDPKAVLGDYLRLERGLTGLQMPCRQGGCGSCTVILSPIRCSSSDSSSSSSSGKKKKKDAVHVAAANHADDDDGGGGGGDDDEPLKHRPVNACLLPLCSVDGKRVTTVEGIGSTKHGLHPVQQAIVTHNGTQCGFCTPGMVMSMYGLVVNNSQPTAQQVEDQLDGNLCRCTGYRPILDGFQTFANCNNNNNNNNNKRMCNKSGEQCASGCDKEGDVEELGSKRMERWELPDARLMVSRDGLKWVRAVSLDELYALLQTTKHKGRTIRMVRGNTSSGIYPPPAVDVLADISRISKLMEFSVQEKGISIGGAVPITDFMVLLERNQSLSPSYGPLLKHLKRVAHNQVRNIGSVAGNLMLTHAHGEFASDISTILMAAEAKLRVGFGWENGDEHVISLEQFFNLSLDGAVIVEIFIPVMKASAQFFTYKVALRRVNAHALLNAGFKLAVNSLKGVFESNCVIVYGGVRPYPQRARKTEAYLAGKKVFDPKVFADAVQILQRELVVDPALGRTEYRTRLLAAFFYKAYLSLFPQDTIPPRLRSSIVEYVRPVSQGEISFDEGDPSEYPVSKPIPKLSAGLQATGEAQYLDDMVVGGSLYATFVQATVANAALKSIDPSKALAMKGVITFISAASLKANKYCNLVSEDEEVFASERVLYYGQAVGLVVANTKALADEAAKLVVVTYSDVQKPILTFEDAIAADSFYENRRVDLQIGTPEIAMQSADVVIEGQVSLGHQYHFHLETQRAICIPGEDNSMDVYSSTQNPSQVQHCVGVGLNRPQHKIIVHVKRLGGAYGSKLNRSIPIAMACALAADKLQKPVKLILDIGTNMQVVGGRSPYRCDYKIGVMKDGRITSLQLKILNNHGAHFDFEYPMLEAIPVFIDNVYKIPNWDIKAKAARTNLPACTWMRGPVFVETVFMMETMVEHVASVLGMAPDLVREVNMYKKGDTTLAGQYLEFCNVKEVLDSIKESSGYETRVKQVKEFNSSNQWVKRGISLVPVKFSASWTAVQHIALVNIYPDGSVSIHQSGCEMGQGLDVKVAQVAAMSLGSIVEGGLDMANIKVQTTTSVIANNVGESGGSVTSELCAMAVQVACNKLVERLRVTSSMLTTVCGKPSWHELIEAALTSGIDLQARGRIYPGPNQNGPFQYLSFAAAVTEVEVDILTGDTRILRGEVLLDCGKSLNPAIDIGQVHGAYIQGIGYYLSEEYQLDAANGKITTNSTWNYKVPSSKDIPHDFRASLLPNSSNPSGFLRSKFSGEPPYGTACSVLFAVRQAVAAGREEIGANDWCSLSAPATVEKVALAANVPTSFLSLSLQSQ